jgi:antirestriction protein ArdC
MKNRNTPNYQELLLNAINPENEKRIAAAYSAFHNYSILNQFLAMTQMDEVSPIATFNQWKKKGRFVNKGSKAIALYMPITIDEKDDDGKKTGNQKMFFALKNQWFSFDQTNGAEVEAVEEFAEWDQSAALVALDIEQIKYNKVNGNAQGFAIGRGFAINPVAANPIKTTFHELAHIVSGHTDPENSATADLDKATREVEAETIAFICCAVLGHSEKLAESRGYIQNYLAETQLTDKSIKRIYSTANKIIKAGTK